MAKCFVCMPTAYLYQNLMCCCEHDYLKMAFVVVEVLRI